MAGIRIHDARDSKWIVVAELAAQQRGAAERPQFKDTDPEMVSPIRMHEPGDENSLQLFEVDVAPNSFVDVHSHGTDEIMYVVKGSLVLGKRSLGPGSSVFIAGDTLYSFRSGPDGLRFLNFRPHKDVIYRTREQHLA